MKKIYQLPDSMFVPSDDTLIAFEDKTRGVFVKMTVGELMRRRAAESLDKPSEPVSAKQ